MCRIWDKYEFEWILLLYIGKFCHKGDNVKLKYMYNICCDWNIGVEACVMCLVPCACVGCKEQMKLSWIPGTISAYQPLYDNEIQKRTK